MQTSNPRNLALKVLNRVSPRASLLREYSEPVLQAAAKLENRDKALINQLVQGVLRWRLRLDWVIEQTSAFPLKKIDPVVLNILRLAVFQILFLDKIPQSAAVNEAVKQTRKQNLPYLASFVNGVLRNICRSKPESLFPDRTKEPVRFLAVYYSYPEWLVHQWIVEWGVETCEKLLHAGNQIPVTTLCTNSLRINRSDLIKRLEQEGLSAKATDYSPLGIDLSNLKGSVTELATFKAGLFQVQDQAAQICAYLLAPQPGESVLDICAGLGGKSLHMAQLQIDQGLIIALDLDPQKLVLQQGSAERLGVRSIQRVVADATGPLSTLFKLRFDKVIVDAPCSGLGVLARHPDGKWNRAVSDLVRLAQLQAAILHTAAGLLKKGGRLLYATCTISQIENQGVITGFLQGHPDFSLVDLHKSGPPWATELVDAQGFLQTFPHLHAMNGFFAALLQKNDSA